VNDRTKGILIFGGIALLFLAIGILAFLATGPMGIEERFTRATSQGSDGSSEEEGVGMFGFGIEGSVIGYVIMLIILAAAAIFLWRRSRKL